MDVGVKGALFTVTAWNLSVCIPNTFVDLSSEQNTKSVAKCPGEYASKPDYGCEDQYMNPKNKDNGLPPDACPVLVKNIDGSPMSICCELVMRS